MATMSMIALYNLNDSIFDDFQVPEQIDKDTLIKNILRNTGNLEVFYSDADFMKLAIQMWSSARIQSWNKMADVLFAKYDPFINVQRNEVRTITQERDLHSTTKNDGTTTDGIAAWNDTESVERSKQTLKEDASASDTGKITTTEHFHLEGDSPITDAQDVLRNEVEVRKDFNLYNIIENEFKKEFCILVY